LGGGSSAYAVNYSLDFDGSNDYVKITPGSDISNFATNDAISLQGWVKVNSNGFDFWITLNDLGGSPNMIQFRYGSNSSGVPYWDTGAHDDETSSDYTFVDEYVHVVFTAGKTPLTVMMGLLMEI